MKFLVHSNLLAFALVSLMCNKLCISSTSAFVAKQHSERIINTRLNSDNNNGESDFITPDMGDVGFVLLAGGTGSRMKAGMRK
jgi:hypothetical protein